MHLINLVPLLKTDIANNFSTCISIPTNINFKTNENVFTMID